MIKVLIGNLFDSKMQTWVNTVNRVGIMGKGIALEFKKRFPDMYKDYVQRCEKGEVKLGKPYIYKRLLEPWIINFPTKDHWRSLATLESIKAGLDYLVSHYKDWGVTSMAIPPLGCGEGQLEWRIVGPTLYRYLEKMDIPVELYAPYGTPHEELKPDFLKGQQEDKSNMPEPRWIEPGWFALVEILNRIENQPYHWPVGRTTFQKIAYVATEENIPTGLEYRKSSYGPFAPAFKKMVSRLMNNGLIEEKRIGSMFSVEVGPTYPDARTAYKHYVEQWENSINEIVDLFARLNTNQAEIVATVIYSSKELKSEINNTPSEMDVLNKVMEWKQKRRPPLNEKEVAYTIRNLAALDWLDVKGSKELPVEEEDVLYA